MKTVRQIIDHYLSSTSLFCFVIVKFEMSPTVKIHTTFFNSSAIFILGKRVTCAAYAEGFSGDARWIIYLKEKTKVMIVDKLKFSVTTLAKLLELAVFLQ